MSEQTVKVGVLVPTGNIVHEREFARLQPSGVNFRFASFPYPDMSSANACDDLLYILRAPLAALSPWQPACMLLGCTTASMICTGKQFLTDLERMAGCPVVTAAAAARAALRTLGVRRLSVATPYGHVTNDFISSFLTKNGFSVLSIAGQTFDRSPAEWQAGVKDFTARDMLDFALSIDQQNSDGLYLPCTAFSSLDAIAAFEHYTGKPAVSSVQAGYWACMRLLGFDGRTEIAGSLLRRRP